MVTGIQRTVLCEDEVQSANCVRTIPSVGFSVILCIIFCSEKQCSLIPYMFAIKLFWLEVWRGYVIY